VLPPYFTSCSRSLPLRVQPVYSSTITCAFRRSLLKCLFGAKLQDVFTAGLPRASHLPAAFCAYLPAATCSYHSLLTYKITCIINTANLFVKCFPWIFLLLFIILRSPLNSAEKPPEFGTSRVHLYPVSLLDTGFFMSIFHFIYM